MRLVFWIVFIASILHLTGFGGEWQLLPNSPTISGRHDDIFFLNPRLGWIASPNGYIHRTTDAGDTWDDQAYIGELARSIGFVDSLTGWVGTISAFPGSGLYATTDGGFSWSPVTAITGPPPESICGISIVDDSVVYASGAYYGVPRVIKTTDRGDSWQSFNLDTLAGALVDCYFFNRDSGIVVGSTDSATSGQLWGHALVLSTGDGGNTWRASYVGMRDEELCWKISFPTGNFGYVSIEDFSPPGPVYYLRTTDRGMTWEDRVFLDIARDEQGIGFVTPDVGWIGGWGGDTYGTTDAGKTWSVTGPGRNVNRFRFFGDSLGFAVGDRAYRYSRDSVGTAVPWTSPATVERFELYQNFPNPFNPTTTIRFLLPQQSPVKISILDVLGRNVVTILDEVKPAGEHVVGWNGMDEFGNQVSSGIYFYRMQAPFHISSKKLVLLR